MTPFVRAAEDLENCVTVLDGCRSCRLQRRLAQTGRRMEVMLRLLGPSKDAYSSPRSPCIPARAAGAHRPLLAEERGIDVVCSCTVASGAVAGQWGGAGELRARRACARHEGAGELPIHKRTSRARSSSHRYGNCRFALRHIERSRRLRS